MQISIEKITFGNKNIVLIQLFYHYKLHLFLLTYTARLFSDVYCIRFMWLADGHWMLLSNMAYFSSILTPVQAHLILQAATISGSDSSKYSCQSF